MIEQAPPPSTALGIGGNVASLHGGEVVAVKKGYRLIQRIGISVTV